MISNIFENLIAAKMFGVLNCTPKSSHNGEIMFAAGTIENVRCLHVMHQVSIVSFFLRSFRNVSFRIETSAPARLYAG